MDEVFARAKQIVSFPKTEFGYVDVGDALVSYLRGDIDKGEALQRLEDLQIDYDRARAKQR